MLALAPWTVDLRVTLLAARSSAISLETESSVGTSTDAEPISVYDPLMANFLDCIFCHCGAPLYEAPSQIAIYA
jgi:hypothetical protein